MAERVRAHAGKRVTLGVRPEALQLANGADPPTTASTPRWTWSSRSATKSCSTSAPAASPMVARVDPGVRVKAHEASASRSIRSA